MAGKVQHNGFSSKAYGRNRRKYTVRYFSRPYRQRTHHKEDGGGSMMTKMGICVLLAGLVLLSDFADSRGIAIEASSDVGKSTDDIGGDYLGKLRFVELPGIIQVFSSDAKLRVGVEYDSYHINDQQTIMTINGITSAIFPSPTDGTIKTLVSESETTKIEISADGDIVISFAANGTAAVEEGQPVKSGDTLFKDIKSVEIGMTKAGRPVDPTLYFDMNDALFS